MSRGVHLCAAGDGKVLAMSEGEHVRSVDDREPVGPPPTDGQDDVHAPVPDPHDDLSHLTVFDGDDTGPGADDASGGGAGDAGDADYAAYDDETDLAVPAHEPHADTAFTPLGASVPDPTPGPFYDVDRDTGL